MKASAQPHGAVGDPANDALRVDASELRAKAIGEGANLAITQAARIEFAELGGRINTDFIDNSAGVDCSDNEVNIKIPLNREMAEGRLSEAKRNTLLARMTDDVVGAGARGQSAADAGAVDRRGGRRACVAGLVRTIELLETSGRLDRKVEGLATSEQLLRRAQENRGLTRPELAVVLSMAKITLQEAAEGLKLADDPSMEDELFAAFPEPMREAHGDAIRAHRLKNEIVATKVANRFVNRLGPSVALDMTDEEGASLARSSRPSWSPNGCSSSTNLGPDRTRRSHREDHGSSCSSSPPMASARISPTSCAPSDGEMNVKELCALLAPGLAKVAAAARDLIKAEVRHEAAARGEQITGLGASHEIVRGLVKLYELDGVFGIAALGARKKVDELALTRAYIRLGEALGLDWAQQPGQAVRSRRSVGAAAERGAGARFRAVEDRVPGARPQRGSRGSGRALGRAQCRRGPRSSAS